MPVHLPCIGGSGLCAGVPFELGAGCVVGAHGVPADAVPREAVSHQPSPHL
ncbi:hypothetical protein OIO03_22895 [Acinetobacter baumannii]|nr:hypothetical protein [Acinetobacter baumannii]MCW1766453.1 hypothetical protein [Acinetobacter baumannii]